jgi:hypothetical protein
VLGVELAGAVGPELEEQELLLQLAPQGSIADLPDPDVARRRVGVGSAAVGLEGAVTSPQASPAPNRLAKRTNLRLMCNRLAV